MQKNQWVGLDPEKFKPYQKWQTPAGYLCGTYATAVLLAYYQDQLDENILPAYLRLKNQSDCTTLVNFLRLFIQKHGLPTIAPQLSCGLENYFSYINSPHHARATLIGGWQRAVKRLDAGQPLIVGLNAMAGSTYGNHWVVAYAYYENDAGQRFLKIHDNWGNYEKVIPQKWLNATISLC
ncbi:MAG TPA: C39 family peptidase [Tetragenococcus sp.]|nr:C39 family peptidase [Tetragenococcus sp.]